MAVAEAAVDYAPGEKIAREVEKAPEAASVNDLLAAIKYLTYTRGSLILTARKRGEESPRTAARVARIEAQLTQYAALVDAKRK